MRWHRSWAFWTAIGMLGIWLASVCFSFTLAAERSRRVSQEQNKEEVELFQAIKAGQISVRLIPQDSKRCTVMIENKTKQPLTVRLPSAFAGVPVLAQLDGGGVGFGGRGGGFDGGYGGGYGGGQAFGGGWGGWGGMGGMGGMGMGMWSIPPEKIATLKVPTVCLEFGKPDPRPQMQYEIKPIDEYTDNQVLHEVIRALASGVVPQRIAQLAAWHLANGLSWQELASQQYRHANGTRSPAYSPAEIQAAMNLVAAASHRVEQQKRSAGYDSLSQR